MLGSREQGSRFLCRGGEKYSLGNWNLIKAGKKERNRNRKPYKEGRVVGVVSAVVILATIIPALPVAGAVTPASVVPITPVVISVFEQGRLPVRCSNSPDLAVFRELH